MCDQYRKKILYSCFLAALALLIQSCNSESKKPRIDRKVWVERHQVTVNEHDTLSSLSVGNGRFAFTVDFTGLQTFPEAYKHGIPLGTESDWGWHRFPNANASHHFHLGMVGLELLHADGSPVRMKDILSISQTLNPWDGEIHSSFLVDGSPVEVITYAHQDVDLISTRINSRLLEQGLLKIRIRFPYPDNGHSDDGCDWSQPAKHTSLLQKTSDHSALIQRQIDSTRYTMRLQWEGKGSINEKAPHEFYIVPDKGQKQFSFSCLFAARDTLEVPPDYDVTAKNSAERWKAFWMNGAAVDFKGSTDLRANELERLVVLSLYLTRVQCAGYDPSLEAGRDFQPFHTGTYFWRTAHFALWGHPELLEQSLDYYARMVQKTSLTEKNPEFIYLAELLYRCNPSQEILKKYAGLVFTTADAMASYAWYDSINKRYILQTPMFSAREGNSPETAINQPFELSCWHYGLSMAQMWRERMNMGRNTEWDQVLNQLSLLPHADGLYLVAENIPQCYTDRRYMTGHPMVLGAYGVLPASAHTSAIIMKNTFMMVYNEWNWDNSCGWDFPMAAMCGVRLGVPAKGLEILLKQEAGSNTWLPNGHNYQKANWELYLPANGALLDAIDMMCAGFDGATTEMPGIPKDGKWKVTWEGLKKMP
jgi:protein-glucosylgalactosylhydroxylysine glucosidase